MSCIEKTQMLLGILIVISAGISLPNISRFIKNRLLSILLVAISLVSLSVSVIAFFIFISIYRDIYINIIETMLGPVLIFASNCYKILESVHIDHACAFWFSIIILWIFFIKIHDMHETIQGKVSYCKYNKERDIHFSFYEKGIWVSIIRWIDHIVIFLILMLIAGHWLFFGVAAGLYSFSIIIIPFFAISYTVLSFFMLVKKIKQKVYQVNISDSVAENFAPYVSFFIATIAAILQYFLNTNKICN